MTFSLFPYPSIKETASSLCSASDSRGSLAHYYYYSEGRKAYRIPSEMPDPVQETIEPGPVPGEENQDEDTVEEAPTGIMKIVSRIKTEVAKLYDSMGNEDV